MQDGAPSGRPARSRAQARRRLRQSPALGEEVDGRVWSVLLIGLVAVVVAALLWRHNQGRARFEREREERRARTDQMLARVLLGEDRGERHTIGGPADGTWPEPPAAPAEPTASMGRATRQPVDIDILLDGEPSAIAEQARSQLGRPTTLLSGLSGEPTVSRPQGGSPSSSPLSLLEGRIEVPLDALVAAWFAARGYVLQPAPDSAQPIRLLMTHRDDPERTYAFFFDRGRLHAQRAATLLEKARALGMHRLLVAAEHGADAAVSSSRLRDVVVVDWVALDRELKKIDFSVAAKLIAIARTRRAALGLA